MNKIIKILVESKFNFNIDVENDIDNREMYKLSKLKHNSISLKFLVDIINAFNNQDLSVLDDNERKYLYDNFELFKQYQYKVKDKDELIDIIEFRGDNVDLNWIDISNVTSMNFAFGRKDTQSFNGNISKWDTSNIEDMTYMFFGSSFTGDISEWDVSKVKDMSYMFAHSNFNGNISNWNVSNVMNTQGMFEGSYFRQNISNWNIQDDCDVSYMWRQGILYNVYKPEKTKYINN